MQTKFIETLKQDVARWQEAAKTIEGLIPKMSEPDRAQWAERMKRYQANASEIRVLIEEISKTS